MTCIGCDNKDQLATSAVEQIIKEQLELEVNLVTEAMLQRRLASCESCSFRSNHTCTKCGCFYQFRANLTTKNCPEKRW